MKKGKPGPNRGYKQAQVKRTPLGLRLFRARRAKGLTQEQLGELVGLSKRMVAHYEVGSKAMTVEMLQRIANTLGFTVAQLLGEKEIANNTTPIKPAVRKRIEALISLPPVDQQAIFRMIDNANNK